MNINFVNIDFNKLEKIWAHFLFIHHILLNSFVLKLFGTLYTKIFENKKSDIYWYVYVIYIIYINYFLNFLKIFMCVYMFFNVY